MRRITMIALMAAVLGGVATAAPSPAQATRAVVLPDVQAAAVQPAQYYGDQHHRRGGQWRKHRRAHDQARIAAAARREAWRIERERAHRRAWRRAQRHQYGYYQRRGW